MNIIHIPSIEEVYRFFRLRSSRPVTWFELYSSYPYCRGKVRARVRQLEKQGYIVRTRKDEWKFSEAFL